MSPLLASAIVFSLLVYAAAGFLVATILIFLAPNRFDPAVAGGTRGFRFLIFPAAALLWPLLMKRAVFGPALHSIEEASEDARTAGP